MVEPHDHPHIYPLGESPTGTDPRCSISLVIDVADVMTKHGYPDVIALAAGGDLLNLQQALIQFIYGTTVDAGRHVRGCSVWSSPSPGCDCGGDQR